jgi:hypothetical protein
MRVLLSTVVLVGLFLCSIVPELITAAIVDREDKGESVIANEVLLRQQTDDQKTVECEFFDQSCARAREQGEDISSCFGSKKCRDEVDPDEGGGAETEAFCYTVWQNGSGLPGAWNIKKQGCLLNHGSSQVSFHTQRMAVLRIWIILRQIWIYSAFSKNTFYFVANRCG